MTKYSKSMRMLQEKETLQLFGALLSAFVLLLGGMRGFGGEAEAATWKVTDASDSLSSPGQNTLRGIIGRAIDGDIVSFAFDIKEIELQGELVVDKSLTITAFPPERVTIRQTAAGAGVFSIPAGKQVHLLYLTITGGRASWCGGGIINYGTLSISYCTITDNTADHYGGGVSNEKSGVLTIKNSLVKGNSASGSGGVWNSGRLTMEDCVVEENMCSAGSGGGIGSNGAMTLNRCTIRNNLSTIVSHSGGGVYTIGAAEMTGCTVKGNSAATGGGIENRGDLTLSACTISGNTAGRGGGINAEGRTTIMDSAIESNASTSSGGGIELRGELTLTKCFILKNTSANGGGINVATGTATMKDCVVRGNSATASGGGMENGGEVNLINCIVSDNTAAGGGGINVHTYKTSVYDTVIANLKGQTKVYSNTPDQILGPYTADGTCMVGSSSGTASVAFGGVVEGVSPQPRKTSGEADVTAVESDLKNPESGIFTAVKSALSADLGGLPGDVSAGLSGMNATLYNAFAYENVRLEDSSGRGKLEVEFTASWPQNVRYYAALAEYEDAATLAVKGYVIPDRGVQFEIKPGQALPDGATPPDFYEEGEGLMTWRNVIADNGPYDHDRQVGVVTFRVASIRAEAQTTAAASGGSGCSAVGAPPFALLLGVPLLLLRKKRP